MKGLALESIHVIRNLAADTSDERPPWHFYCDSMDLAAALCAFGLKPDRSPYGCEALIASYTDQILELLARSFHLPESVQTEPPPTIRSKTSGGRSADHSRKNGPWR